MSVVVPSGNSSGVEFSGVSGLANVPTQLTVAVWWRPTNLSDTNGIFARHNTTLNGWSVRQRTGGNFQFTLARDGGTPAGVNTTTDAPLVVNEWVCLAGTIDTGAASGACYSGTFTKAMAARAGAYSNGVGSTGSNAGLPVKLMNRGAAGSNTNGCPGELAVAALWERVLTLPELIEWQVDPMHAAQFGQVFFCAPGIDGTLAIDRVSRTPGSFINLARLETPPAFLRRRPLARRVLR